MIQGTFVAVFMNESYVPPKFGRAPFEKYSTTCYSVSVKQIVGSCREERQNLEIRKLLKTTSVFLKKKS